MREVNYKKGLSAFLVCFLIWGFQPLYWYICGQWDTFFMLACRIIWAAVCCLCILWIQGKLPQLWAVFRDRQSLKREIPAAVFLLADCYHPSALLRDIDKRPEAFMDLRALRKEIKAVCSRTY